jgi:hypothetical protein
MHHPGVRRAAVVSHEGRRILLLEMRGDKQHVPSGLAHELDWARLDLLRVVSRIPMDARHNAKVDYRAVRALLRELRE